MNDSQIIALWNLAKGFDVDIAPKIWMGIEGCGVRGSNHANGVKAYMDAIKNHFEDGAVSFDDQFIYFKQVQSSDNFPRSPSFDYALVAY
jgi:hypothetical protein